MKELKAYKQETEVQLTRFEKLSLQQEQEIQAREGKIAQLAQDLEESRENLTRVNQEVEASKLRILEL